MLEFEKKMASKCFISLDLGNKVMKYINKIDKSLLKISLKKKIKISMTKRRFYN